MNDPKRIYRPEEVNSEVVKTHPDVELFIRQQFDMVPLMGYDEALSILSWHLCINTVRPGASDPNFASAFKTVMLKIIGEKS